MQMFDHMVQGHRVKKIIRLRAGLKQSQADVQAYRPGLGGGNWIGFDAEGFPPCAPHLQKESAVAATNIQNLSAFAWIAQIPNTLLKTLPS